MVERAQGILLHTGVGGWLPPDEEAFELYGDWGLKGAREIAAEKLAAAVDAKDTSEISFWRAVEVHLHSEDE